MLELTTMSNPKGLTYHEAKWIDGKAKGMGDRDAALYAGYKPSNASIQASRLKNKPKIQAALEKSGLTDKFLSDSIKRNIVEGTGVKATADTATKNIELALRLKGYLNIKEETNNTQNNIYINELHELSDELLTQRLQELQGAIIVDNG